MTAREIEGGRDEKRRVGMCYRMLRDGGVVLMTVVDLRVDRNP